MRRCKRERIIKKRGTIGERRQLCLENQEIGVPLIVTISLPERINKQDIFFDNNDKAKLLKEISRTKEKYEYELYAYVLMPNHIHLLIKENTHSISEIMRSLLISYAEYINKKYDRIGYVFQNRFTSRPVENDIYFRNVVRYIHLNPQKAGISIYSQYKWSQLPRLLQRQ